MVGADRGVSTVLGLTLLFAIVMAGMVLVVAVGGTALTDTRESLDTSRAEKAMTQFDSRSAMVALGGTSHQGVDLAAGANGGYGVDPDAGWMNVTVYNETADNHTEVVNATLGALVYENGEESIAYQGGGVWKRTEAGVTMLSPPEFHFREATLTLPIVTVGGAQSLGTDARVTRAGPTTVRYPNASANDNFTNPLDNGHVNVTVHSEYYEAWGAYFEGRTDGNVSYDHENQIVRAKLVVPFDEEYANVLATTQPGGITMNGADPPPEPSETGTNYPLIDDRIESKVDECESDPTACDDFPGTGHITSGGTYFADSDVSSSIHVDNPGDDVTLVVDGNFQPASITIDGSHNLTVLVRNSFSMGSANLLNDGGDAVRLTVGVHSSGAVNGNGNFRIVGLIYAPGSDCSFNGGGAVEPNVIGAAVCETVTVNGNPNDFDYDSSVQRTNLDLGGDTTPITFLHVTENPINVSGG